MGQIVFNSFPRSGNVYQGSLSGHFFDRMQAQVHMPEILGVKEIHNIVVFRKPEDAIASLIMKQSQSDTNIHKNQIIKSSKENYEIYKKYIDCAKTNKDIIYIGKFDKLINDTVKHFENVSIKFDIPLVNNYKESFLKAKFDGKLWDDRYDGHVPRPKDSVRLNIEENVNSLSFIQELNHEYEEFILKYETTV
jgi:hypothetical protein